MLSSGDERTSVVTIVPAATVGGKQFALGTEIVLPVVETDRDYYLLAVSSLGHTAVFDGSITWAHPRSMCMARMPRMTA
ncbi:hypothetical protein [Candidatus Amarolinea dominans]|uniref:hypothetical protein n=1 Tax=Candidatus Amarolinea dominans TaxID=3140696 RepID=UPI003136074E|nr:hypothetical protein [Anaerolineae bacterium]